MKEKAPMAIQELQLITFLFYISYFCQTTDILSQVYMEHAERIMSEVKKNNLLMMAEAVNYG